MKNLRISVKPGGYRIGAEALQPLQRLAALALVAARAAHSPSFAVVVQMPRLARSVLMVVVSDWSRNIAAFDSPYAPCRLLTHSGCARAYSGCACQ